MTAGKLRDFAGGSRSNFYSVLNRLKFYRLIEKNMVDMYRYQVEVRHYIVFLVHLVDSLDSVDLVGYLTFSEKSLWNNKN